MQLVHASFYKELGLSDLIHILNDLIGFRISSRYSRPSDVGPVCLWKGFKIDNWDSVEGRLPGRGFPNRDGHELNVSSVCREDTREDTCCETCIQRHGKDEMYEKEGKNTIVEPYIHLLASKSPTSVAWLPTDVVPVASPPTAAAADLDC